MEAATESASVEPEALKVEVVALQGMAPSVIRNDSDFQSASEWLRRIKAALKRADEFFDPMIDSARGTWKAALAMKAEVVDLPLKTERHVKNDLIAPYLREQERLRLEQQRIAEEAARKLAEDEALARAAALEAAGRPEEAEEVLERPLAPMPVIVSTPMPRAEGVSRRVNYRAVVTDLKALVRHVTAHPEHSNLLLPNGPALNQLAKSMRGDLNIPGVRVMADDIISATAG